MIKKLLIWSLFILLTFFGYLQFKVNFYNDLSTRPIDPLVLNESRTAQRPPVYLVTYADGPEVFWRNQNALAQSALNKGIDFIHNYKRSLLDAKFVAGNKAILDQKKGAGYWLWKPYIILETMKAAPDGAIVIYADSGYIFRGHIKFFDKYLKHNDALFPYWSSCNVGKSVKRDALIKLACDNLQCRSKPHIFAAFMVFKNSSATRAFVKQWLQNCCDLHLITDTPSHNTEHTDFIQHMHDEAILSIAHAQTTLKIHLITIKELSQSAYWHHRHPGKEYRSLLVYTIRKLRGFERDVINCGPMMKLRQFLSENF